MGTFFSSKEDALVWLVANGWRQNRDGVWLKGKFAMDLRPSPLSDGVYCLVKRKADESELAAPEL